MMKDDEITEKIIACAYAVHNALGAGFLEKVYENALVIKIRKAGLEAAQQLPIHVYYENEIVGDFFADLLVANRIIIEVKAVENLLKKHEVQLVNYLAATRKDTGLLINFGSSVEVKRKFRIYAPKIGQD
jgi:GxxExxY protein